MTQNEALMECRVSVEARENAELTWLLLFGLQYSAKVLQLSISFPDKSRRWLSVEMLVASATLFFSSATVIFLGTCALCRRTHIHTW
jgi:hypothetical protein